MTIQFLNDKHAQLYNDYCHKACVHPDDRERKAMFYILAGCPDIVSKGINRIYDFKDNMVKFHPDTLEQDFEQFSFCSSSHALCRLALNLYNGSYKSLSFADTFYNLDNNHRILAVNALLIRFGINLNNIEPDFNSNIEKRIVNSLLRASDINFEGGL